MKIANLFTDEWDDEQEHASFRIQDRLTREVDAPPPPPPPDGSPAPSAQR